MKRRRLIESMPGDFLRIMGKVLLFTGGGMGLAMAFGGAALALGSILGAVATIGAGAGCLVAASAVHRRSLEAFYSCDGASRDGGGPAVATPMEENGELEPPGEGRFVAMVGRSNGVSAGRGA